MPKHVPSFKHLLATSQTRQEEKPRERSVSEILARSRANHPAVRDVPPHLAGQQAAWVPNGDTSIPPIGPSVGCIHPAELARRSAIDRRTASRGVAGPAPPPSWRNTRDVPTPSIPSSSPVARGPITPQALASSTTVFERGSVSIRASGAEKLVEHCFSAVLGYMSSEEKMGEGNEECSLGDVMSAQVGYLDTHLKIGMLSTASILPEADSRRLDDKGLLALLAIPPDAADTQFDEDWADTTAETVHHLPLTLHPHPISILRMRESMPALALTSLNLAYSTISDLSRLVAHIPPSLRELSLRGVRGPGGDVRADDWVKGLMALGRKLIVLKKLDLSEPPFPISTNILTALLHPPQSRLPSLQKLVLRESGHDLMDRNEIEMVGYKDVYSAVSNGQANVTEQERRRQLTGVIRAEGRKKFVEIVWE